MRRELKKHGIERLKVIYSEEEPIINSKESENGKPVPASISFVPSVAGLIIAGEVIKDLIK
jgi:tRNA A37 threonylcarbamoyladenosine dehydratase